MTTAMAVATFACERLDVVGVADGDLRIATPPKLGLVLRGPAEVDRLLSIAGVGLGRETGDPRPKDPVPWCYSESA